MQREVRTRLCFIAAVFSVILGIACFNKIYATGLAWSFVNGETAIGFWMAIGVSLKKAVFIATACSTLETVAWFWLIPHKQKPIGEDTRLHRWFRRAPYLALPVFGFITGLKLPGIALSKVFKFDDITAFVLITSGNSIKMILSGLGFGLVGAIFKLFR